MKTPLKFLLTIFFVFATVIIGSAQQPVTPVKKIAAPNGLPNKNVAIWGSHGYYYNEQKGRWLWQRPHLFETVEDLFTSSYVIDYIAPMLENAGAYVMMPRERDTSPVEVIIDYDNADKGYVEINGRNKWEDDEEIFGYVSPVGNQLKPGQNPFKEGYVRKARAVTKPSEESKATWNANIPQEGTYSIYVSYATVSEPVDSVKTKVVSPKKAKYTVNSLRGPEEFYVDQTMGAGTWIRLGEFPLAAGMSNTPIVTLSNLVSEDEAGAVVTADAVKIGGGMGNVVPSKSGRVSGLPRWAEGARYWLQSAGFPESVYTVSSTSDKRGKHYVDDYTSRPQWVNYLAGGSKANPNQKGLGIPVDISFALHSDAGIRNDDSFIGTLGIYTASGGSRLGDGRSRSISGDLTESVLNQIVKDVRKIYNPDWSNRNATNKSYAESNRPVVPATLIEMLSHQNFADMKYGNDPQFKFDLSRAIYKGIGRFLASQDKREFIVQPLPVNTFGIISLGNGKYRLSWQPTPDPTEPSAMPDTYIIERRIGEDDVPAAFRIFDTTKDTQFEYTATPGQVTSFRIVAVNKGGKSFPSEELALCYINNNKPEVLIINGFTRISTAESYSDSSNAGFYKDIDPGVPYHRNIAYTGQQVIFDRNVKYADDVVNPGAGGSLSGSEGYPVGGNMFNYPLVHGTSVKENEFSFVSTSIDAFIKYHDSYKEKIIDLILGAQREVEVGVKRGAKTKFKGFTPQLQQILVNFVKNGGNLLVSGAYVGSDLLENIYSSEQTLMQDEIFAKEVLNMQMDPKRYSRGGKINITLSGNDGHKSAVAIYTNKPEKEKDFYAISRMDAIKPFDESKSKIIATYPDNNATAGFFTKNGNSNIAVFSFPLESIKDAEIRDDLLDLTLRFLSENIAPKQTPKAAPPADNSKDKKNKKNKDKKNDKKK